eukprot:TRINITY_DN6350_c0_g1_i3.p1 TRINITY_DN6350_c0_g1~~TRINITY_DN6350_c0_g1_i3.p1  ORF type:complete len:338 (+),score=80.22 TRINITY_DN6350_c0_g1_i3:38-1015(+)
MRTTVLLVACALAVAVARPVVHQKMVDYINSRPGQTWTASMDTPRARLSHQEAKRALGIDMNNRGLLPTKLHAEEAFTALPASFDARENWPDCQSIKMIRDQSDCGSCWAQGSTESMSDRECIINGRDIILSAEDMNSCSHNGIIDCGSCNGGQDACAWQYFMKVGVVTESCAPYSLPSCDHHIENSTNPCKKIMYPTPDCPATCTNTSDNWVKYKGTDAYAVHGEQNIMTEIMKNGPCETAFTVYEDFESYKGGIYKHTTGDAEGGHAVKFIGWGVEDGQNRHLVWNVHWASRASFALSVVSTSVALRKLATPASPRSSEKASL